MKLLIADDQELILESLSIVLGMEDDMEIIGLAKDGREAVRLSEELHPDLVLMDIHMPNLDGVQATRLIKERDPNIKIIMLTSYKEIDYVLEALSYGAEGYLLKAIHPKHLIAGIRVVFLGGTLISQDMASDVVKKWKQPAAQPQIDDSELSSREIEVLQKLALGLRNQEIAESLFLSEGTVKNYISNIYAKLNVKGRAEAAKKARESGLLKSSSHNRIL